MYRPGDTNPAQTVNPDIHELFSPSNRVFSLPATRFAVASAEASEVLQPKCSITPNALYYDAMAEQLMRERGIISGKETVQGTLEKTTSSLLAIDAGLNGGNYDAPFARTVEELVEEGIIVYGTPVLTNVGREKKVTAACTVLPVASNENGVDMEAFFAQSEKALSDGVGTGYDLSDLDNPATAIVEMNAALDMINARLIKANKRPVASMATLRADHPEIIDFIRAKKHEDFGKWRFNISVFVTEELFEQASIGGSWDLRNTDGEIVESMPAMAVLQEIAVCAHYCGEPGILFKDRIDEDNPTPHWAYKSTAPCAEVAMAEGEACQFSYVNLAGLVGSDGTFDTDRFGVAARTITRLLDASVEHTIRESATGEYPLAAQKRRIGVGITGFADLLARLKIPYDSPRAASLAADISEALDYHSKRESVDLAKTRGEFPAYTESRYTDPEWVQRKIKSSSGVVSPDEWIVLFGEMQSTGIRHASTTSMPPTGTSSSIVAASQSLEPFFSLRNRRGTLPRSVAASLDGAEQDFVLANLSSDGLPSGETLDRYPFLRTARQLDVTAHLKVQSAFQGFLDESLAKTVNLEHSSSVEDVLAILQSAHEGNLKGITVFRDGCLSEQTKK